MKVSEIMNREFFSINKDQGIKEAISEMKNKNTDSLLVEDQGDVVGIVTTHDVLNVLLSDDLNDLKVEEVMTPRLLVVNQSDEIEEAINKFTKSKVDRLGVIDETDEEKELIGLLDSKEVLEKIDFN